MAVPVSFTSPLFPGRAQRGSLSMLGNCTLYARGDDTTLLSFRSFWSYRRFSEWQRTVHTTQEGARHGAVKAQRTTAK
jgi:hypothetical protein